MFDALKYWFRSKHWYVDWNFELRPAFGEGRQVKAVLRDCTPGETEAARASLRAERSHAIIAVHAGDRATRRRSLELVHSWDLRLYVALRSPESRDPSIVSKLLSQIPEDGLEQVAKHASNAQLRIDAAIASGKDEVMEHALLAPGGVLFVWEILPKMSEQAVSALALGKSTISGVSEKIRTSALHLQKDVSVLKSVAESDSPQPIREYAVSKVRDFGLLRSWMGDTSIATAAKRRLEQLICLESNEEELRPWLADPVLGDLISAGLKAIADRQRQKVDRAQWVGQCKAMGQCPDCQGTGKKRNGKSGFLSGGTRWHEPCTRCKGTGKFVDSGSA
ncbi:MAG: zinc finger-like domain-containing protein [Proteobacteria bacterium]|nr:zinc finger-like domain-containing protein [Pseudomonadota bacterium]